MGAGSGTGVGFCARDASELAVRTTAVKTTSTMRRHIEGPLRFLHYRPACVHQVGPFWPIGQESFEQGSGLGHEERHGFDPVTVGVADEGGIVAVAVLRPHARRTIAAAAGRKCRGMEG